MAASDDCRRGQPQFSITSRRVVRGQAVDRIKLTRSKELRRGMTPTERLLWSHLRDNQLNGWHFRRQQVIDGFIADFYCDTVGIIVEVDGKVHEASAEYDAARDQYLRSRGLALVRIPNEEVHTNLRAVLRRIAAACAAGRRQG